MTIAICLVAWMASVLQGVQGHDDVWSSRHKLRGERWKTIQLPVCRSQQHSQIRAFLVTSRRKVSRKVGYPLLFQTLRRQDTHRLDGLSGLLCLDSERRSEKQQGYDAVRLITIDPWPLPPGLIIIRRTRCLPNAHDNLRG